MSAATPAETLKSKLKKRVHQLVVNIDYSNASLVEFLARNGADIIFIDCEQGDTDVESIPNLVRASHIAGKPAIARLYSAEPHVIERYMLRGIDGIVVPRLDNADEVSAVVEEVKYCFPKTHQQKSIIIQLESISAANDLDNILKVQGVDALFIGPVDLAKSMGHGADFSVREVSIQIDDLITKISRAKRSLGMLVTDETITHNISRDVNFLYLHCNDFIRHGANHFISVKPRPARDEALYLYPG